MQNRYIFSLILVIVSALSVSASINVVGSQYRAISEVPAAATGLNEVVVVYNTDGVTLSYSSSTASTAIWQSYGNLGGGYAQPIDDVSVNGNTSSIKASREDTGYIIEDNGKFYYFWIVNYANHFMDAENLSVGPESDCSQTQLLFTGHADHIYYYGINGRQFELDRDIEVSYNTLEWDETTGNYRLMARQQELASIPGGTIHVPAPLTNTVFTLTGDRFLRTWGLPVSITSDTQQAIAVEAHTDALQDTREVPNEKKTDAGEGGLGGSAPCPVSFSATVTDAAIFTEWQFSKTPDFEDISLRMSELDFDYTFRDQGNTYVRFVCANASGNCEYYSDTYTISIGESALDCPNAFSPGASEGVNDEWRVSYKSIVDFECHIFNRAGVKMISLTEPSQGWDGKYGGKVVPAGVYFYVIKATGADGKVYKLSGDINVISYK